MIPRRGRAAIVAALLSMGFFPASSQDLAAWFGRAPEASAYSSVRSAAEALAARIRAAGLPDRLLAERMTEGASKRVPPDRLIAAIGEETSRLELVAGLLSERSLLPAAAEDSAALASEASLLLRAGIAFSDLAVALDAAASRDPAVGAEGSKVEKAERALSATATVYAIHSRFSLAEADRRGLAVALVGSGLERRRFDSLVSVFAAYRARGLVSGRIAAIVIEVLDAKGSLERIERELQRRSTTP
jgi:hypothetical protein